MTPETAVARVNRSNRMPFQGSEGGEVEMTKSSGTVLDGAQRRPAGLGARRGPGNPVGMLALFAVTALVAACATVPEVRTRTAEQVDLASFHTYAFVAKPGTDTGPYKSLTTQQLEKDTAEELQSRGYLAAASGEKPDLLVNFTVGAHDRVEGMGAGPAFGFGWGPGWGAGWGPGWGPYRWGPWGPWGGGYYSDVHTITTVALSIDLIDRSNSSVVWSGTALSELTRHVLDHPAESIDVATHQIFLHFPIASRR